MVRDMREGVLGRSRPGALKKESRQQRNPSQRENAGGSMAHGKVISAPSIVTDHLFDLGEDSRL